MTTYYLGDPVTLTTSTQPFALAATPTVPADPTTVSITVTDPTGTSSTYTYAGGHITKASTGVYTLAVNCNTAGRWRAKITGTGTVARTATTEWDVETP